MKLKLFNKRNKKGDKMPEVKPPAPKAGNKPKTNARDAGSGRFTSKANAKANPKTTVTETASQKRRKAASRPKDCPDCPDKPGLKPGSDTELCPTCNGSGKIKA